VQIAGESYRKLDGFSHVTPYLCCKCSHIPLNVETTLRRFGRLGKVPAFVMMALRIPRPLLVERR
jgi:hypothetical protein